MIGKKLADFVLARAQRAAKDTMAFEVGKVKTIEDGAIDAEVRWGGELKRLPNATLGREVRQEGDDVIISRFEGSFNRAAELGRSPFSTGDLFEVDLS